MDRQNVYSKANFNKLVERIIEELKDESQEFFVHVRTKLEDIDVRSAKDIKCYLSFLKDLFSPLPDIAGINFEIVLRPYDANTFYLQQKISKEILDNDQGPAGQTNCKTSNVNNGKGENSKKSDSAAHQYGESSKCEDDS